MFFEMISGYILASEGDPVITCQASGKWTEATYTCTKVQCAYPGELDNGLIEGENYEFGSQIQLRCNRGWYFSIFSISLKNLATR